jgi:hypothetical protein
MTQQPRETIIDSLARTLAVIRRSAINLAALHNATRLSDEPKMRWQDAVLCDEAGDDETAGSIADRLMAHGRPGGRLWGRMGDRP